jgi:hypothetical protein
MRVVAFLVLLGCSRTDALPITHTCNADADCELVSGAPPNCCSTCASTVMTVSEAAQANGQCRAIAKAEPDYFSRCPHLDCACVKTTAACKDHACVALTGPCGPPQ